MRDVFSLLPESKGCGVRFSAQHWSLVEALLDRAGFVETPLPWPSLARRIRRWQHRRRAHWRVLAVAGAWDGMPERFRAPDDSLIAGTQGPGNRWDIILRAQEAA